MDKLLTYRWANCWPSNLRQSCTKCPVKTLTKHYKNLHFGPTSANTTQNQPKFTYHPGHLLRKKKPCGCRVDKLLALPFFLVVLRHHLFRQQFGRSFISCSSFFFFFLVLVLVRSNVIFSFRYLFSSILILFLFLFSFSPFLFFFSSCVALLVLFFFFLLCSSSSSFLLSLSLSLSLPSPWKQKKENKEGKNERRKRKEEGRKRKEGRKYI